MLAAIAALTTLLTACGAVPDLPPNQPVIYLASGAGGWISRDRAIGEFASLVAQVSSLGRTVRPGNTVIAEQLRSLREALQEIGWLPAAAWQAFLLSFGPQGTWIVEMELNPTPTEKADNVLAPVELAISLPPLPPERLAEIKAACSTALDEWVQCTNGRISFFWVDDVPQRQMQDPSCWCLHRMVIRGPMGQTPRTGVQPWWSVDVCGDKLVDYARLVFPSVAPANTIIELGPEPAMAWEAPRLTALFATAIGEALVPPRATGILTTRARQTGSFAQMLLDLGFVHITRVRPFSGLDASEVRRFVAAANTVLARAGIPRGVYSMAPQDRAGTWAFHPLGRLIFGCWPAAQKVPFVKIPPDKIPFADGAGP